MLSNFNNFYNLNRISTNNADNIFEANVKEGSAFFEKDAMLIVTNLGILAFEKKEGLHFMERKPNLISFIPLVEKMNVI